MNWRIPLSDIDFGSEEISAVQAVLQSRWLTMGTVTQEFEHEFAACVGARHALAVANGTAALHLACLAVGLAPGDEEEQARRLRAEGVPFTTSGRVAPSALGRTR